MAETQEFREILLRDLASIGWTSDAPDLIATKAISEMDYDAMVTSLLEAARQIGERADDPIWRSAAPLRADADGLAKDHGSARPSIMASSTGRNGKYDRKL